jgi:hypothetical protein
MNARMLRLALSITLGAISGCRTASQPSTAAPLTQDGASAASRSAADDAAELVGVYSRASKFYGETLELRPGSRFNYSDWSCVGDGSASGTWRLVNGCVEVARVDGDGGLFLDMNDAGDVSEVSIVLLRIARSDNAIDLVDPRQDEPTPEELSEMNEYQALLGRPPLAPGWNHLRRTAQRPTESSAGTEGR